MTTYGNLLNDTSQRRALEALLSGAVPLPAGWAGDGSVPRLVADKLGEIVSVKDFGAVGGNLGATIAGAGWDLAATRTAAGQSWLQSTDTCDLAAFYIAQKYCEDNGIPGLEFPHDRYVFSSAAFVHSGIHIDLCGSIVRATESTSYSRGKRTFSFGVHAREDYPYYASYGLEFTCDNITKNDRQLTNVSGGSWSPGDAILIRTTEENIDNPTQPLPTIATFNEVLSYADGILTFRYPAEQSVTDPKVVNFSTITISQNDAHSPSVPHVYYCCQNASLRNGKLVGVSNSPLEWNAALNIYIDVEVDAPRARLAFGNGLVRSYVKTVGRFGGIKEAVELGTGSSLSTVEVDGYYSGDDYNPLAEDATAYNIVKAGEKSYKCHIKGRMRAGNRVTGNLVHLSGVECTYDLDIEGEGAAGAAIHFRQSSSIDETFTGRVKCSSCTYHAAFYGSRGLVLNTQFVGAPQTAAAYFNDSAVGRIFGSFFPSGRLIYAAGSTQNFVAGSYIANAPRVIGTNYFSLLTLDGFVARGRDVAHTADSTLTVELALGVTHNNFGATDAVVSTLPPAAAGMEISFARVADYTYRVKPTGTNTIGPGAAGKYLDLGTLGATVHLRCTVDTRWEIVGSSGLVTFESSPEYVERYIPAYSMNTVDSGPTITIFGSKGRGWPLDAAATESVSFTARVPAGYSKMQVIWDCANVGAGSGDVYLDWLRSNFADNVDMSPANTGTQLTVTARAQNVLHRVDLLPAGHTVVPGDLVFSVLRRSGGQASDTLSNDWSVFGATVRFFN